MNIMGSKKKKRETRKEKKSKKVCLPVPAARDEVQMKSVSALKYNIIHCAV